MCNYFLGFKTLFWGIFFFLLTSASLRFIDLLQINLLDLRPWYLFYIKTARHFCLKQTTAKENQTFFFFLDFLNTFFARKPFHVLRVEKDFFTSLGLHIFITLAKKGNELTSDYDKPSFQNSWARYWEINGSSMFRTLFSILSKIKTEAMLRRKYLIF